jgi:glycosyltransferase involved in cell wall biosynthesis
MHASAPLPQVHLVNPLWDPSGGADQRTIETWKLLRDHADVRVWSEYAPDAQLARACPVERIAPWRGRFPRGGTLIFIGTYFRVGHWVRFARPARTVILYNTHQPDRLAKNVRRIAASGAAPEIVYTSQALRRLHAGTGAVLESPIDVKRFRPVGIARKRGFTVGRLSRDIRSKHHAEDPALWRALAEAGCTVRLLGARCLEPELCGVPNIELLPCGAEDPAMFLRTLDCFVYRTSDAWFEAYGRVVLEAMATGLPVVASPRGGYAEHLVDDVNALLFRDSAQAYAQVLALRDEPQRAATLGAMGRAAAVAINTGDLPRRTRAVLLPGVAATAIEPMAAAAGT